MVTSSSSDARSAEQLPKEIRDLRQLIETGVQNPLRKDALSLIAQVEHSLRLQSQLIKMVNDAVDQLQLDIKYLLFDLEATRKERDELRQTLAEEYNREEFDDEGNDEEQ